MSQQAELTEAIRLDKWLWAARFYKTRSVARDAIAGGKVQYNGQRCKPSRVVELGAQIKVPQGYDLVEIEVLALRPQRQSAPLARQMYQESVESEVLRAKNAEARRLNAFHSPKPDHRPDKKQRRQIIQFKQQ
ncbi:RNA-binding S4 domain-containing protein [Paraglaciecola hydrolytica]|uniref:Heat shock protein 15 n=1 Tax=Paraglaciecola hydrolytica TaxID=1799789 RepID=A0A135ZZF3_9ALTE|nr:S4 domain-containing protein [Paraglaciecola hydrolytica]KXI28270.1 heat-shock protein [Paraglaciecola hydrolytica]